jgi:predicted metal-dependent phosphoesterase TrpH
MLIDIHAKTSHSTGVQGSIADALERAKSAGLDAVLFADNHASAHAGELAAAGEAAGVKAFAGVEIHTDRGLLVCVPPSVDAFLLEETWREFTDLTTPSADLIIELVEAMGGAIIASRPYDLDIASNMGDLIFTLNGLHAVEVLNSRVGELQNDFALEASQSLGVNTVGGSDDPARVGDYATLFVGEVADQAALVAALRDGECWAVQLGDVKTQKTSRTTDPFAKKRGRDDGGRGGRDGGGRGRGGRDGGRGRGGRDGGRGGRDGGRGRGGRGRR